MSKVEGRCTHPNCDKLIKDECPRCEAPVCGRHRRGHNCHYACCDVAGAKAHDAKDCPAMKITPEQIEAEKRRLREDVQDRVLGLMARRGIKFENYESFFLRTREYMETCGRYGDPKILATLGVMNQHIVELEKTVKVLRRVAQGDPTIDMPEITEVGLFLDARWEFLPIKT